MGQTHERPQDITLWLQQWSVGNSDALEALMPVVYGELHRQAIGVFVVRSRLYRRTPGERVVKLANLPFKPLVAANRDEALEMGIAETFTLFDKSVAEIGVRRSNFPNISIFRRIFPHHS
ncbi:MAG: hypothetical protein ACR2IH_11625 [Pyrinomonadaceae bacterium]